MDRQAENKPPFLPWWWVERVPQSHMSDGETTTPGFLVQQDEMADIHAVLNWGPGMVGEDGNVDFWAQMECTGWLQSGKEICRGAV